MLALPVAVIGVLRQFESRFRARVSDWRLVVVADSSYAVLELLADAAGLTRPVTIITRLRLDATLYDPAPERAPGTKGRPRLKGARQLTLAQRLVDPQTRWGQRGVANSPPLPWRQDRHVRGGHRRRGLVSHGERRRWRSAGC